MIIADFSGKKNLIEENKKQKLKKSAICKGNLEEHLPFLRKKQNGRKGTFAGAHFCLRKPIIQHIFSFD